MSINVNGNSGVRMQDTLNEEIYNFKTVKIGSIFLKDDGDGKVSDGDFSEVRDEAQSMIIDKYVKSALKWTKTTFDKIVQELVALKKENTVEYYDNGNCVETKNYKDGKWISGRKDNFEYNEVVEYDDGSYKLTYNNGSYIDGQKTRIYDSQDRLLSDGEIHYEYNDNDGTTKVTHVPICVIGNHDSDIVNSKRIKTLQYEIKDSASGKLINGRDKYGMEYTVEYKEDGSYSKKYANGDIEKYDNAGKLNGESRKVDESKAFKLCVKLYMKENGCDKTTAAQELKATFGFWGW